MKTRPLEDIHLAKAASGNKVPPPPPIWMMERAMKAVTAGAVGAKWRVHT